MKLVKKANSIHFYLVDSEGRPLPIRSNPEEGEKQLSITNCKAIFIGLDLNEAWNEKIGKALKGLSQEDREQWLSFAQNDAVEFMQGIVKALESWYAVEDEWEVEETEWVGTCQVPDEGTAKADYVFLKRKEYESKNS